MEITIKIIAAVIGVYISAVLMGLATEYIPSFPAQLTLFSLWLVGLIAFLWLFAKKTSESE